MTSHFELDDEIVVSGIGLITAVGNNAEQSWAAITQGLSGIRAASVVDASALTSDRAGEVGALTPWTPRAVPLRGRGYIDRSHALVEEAVAEAVAHAALDDSDYDSSRVAISLGTSLGGSRQGEEFHRQWLERGLDRADTSLLRDYPLHAVADHVAAVFGFSGARSIQSNACAAGTVAIAYGVELLRSGAADVVVAGGVDPLAYFSFGGFSCLGALDPLDCAPYTRSSGLNLGEGAGVVILERRASLAARGREPIAVVAGYGLSADAHHPTAPDPRGRGALKAMGAALQMDGQSANDVDYVNGHGTGTPANDGTEPKAIAQLRVGPPPATSSTKSMIGHTLGAAGAIEAVVSILAVRDQLLPPTHVPPGVSPSNESIDIVPGQARPAAISLALSNSFAFGGNNAALLLRRSDVASRSKTPSTRAVAITGVSAMAGTAGNTADLVEAVKRNRSLISEQKVDMGSLGSFPVAEIPASHLKRGINPAYLRRMDDLGRRGAVVVADLLRERGLNHDETSGIGLIFATGAGPISTVEHFQRELIETGVGNTRLFPNTVMNAAAGHVALLNRLHGPTATFCSGAVSAISALHFAHTLIASGACDRIIVLSADEAPPALVAGYANVPGYLSRTDSRPFEGSGRVLGGAAVAVLLEAEGLGEGQKPLGRVRGFGLTGDLAGPGRMDHSGRRWADSFDAALRDADLQIDELDVVIAAANGRQHTDEIEMRALDLAGLSGVPLSAPKAAYGDPGATGALLGVTQAIWMGKDEDMKCDEYNLRGRAGGIRRPVQNVLVSSFETGGSYQSIIVQSGHA